MAKLRLVGAVGIKVRPDASDFREEVNQQLRTLPKDAKIKIDVDLDVDPAERAIEKLKREEAKKTLNLKVGVEYDSIQAARRQVESALKNLKTENIPVKLDEGSLTTALAKLKGLQNGAKVTMQINEDKAGYESALAKIRMIQRQKAEVPLTFKTDDKALAAKAKELEKLIANIKEPVKTITIKHKNDRDSLAKAIDQIDAALADLKEVKIDTRLSWIDLMAQKNALTRELESKPLVMKITEDKSGYEKILQKITELQKPKPVELTFDTDAGSLAKAAEEVKAKLKALDSTYKVTVDSSDLGALEKELARVKALMDGDKNKVVIDVENSKESLRAAKDQLDDLIKERKAKVHAEAITFEAAYQLAYASRARTVPFYVKVNEKSLAVAAGLMESLAGINTLRESGELLEKMITKFDTMSLRVGTISTLLGSVTDSLLYMGTALFPIGEGMLNLVGTLALAPTAMAALTSVILVNTMAWNGFKDAASGSDEALKKLPYSARKAALELRGTWESMQQPVQANFWDATADSMFHFAKDTIPVLRDGLVSVADDMGSFFAGALNSINKIAQNGSLQTMFKNLEGFFQNVSKASEPFFDAFNKLGLRGSEYLPKFGQWLADISTQFDNWVTKSDKAGKINVWIDQGVQSLKDMWTMGGGIIKMFEGITMAAKDAGSGGLGAVADEFSRIGDIMKAEPFQSRLSTIFNGARAGASALNVGVKELGTTLGEASLFVANLLSQLGKLGGQALSGLSKTLGNITFQDGILRGLQGMSSMLNQLTPAFDNLGTVIGDLSVIAGGAFSSLPPIINNIVSLLATVTSTLSDNITSLIPNLMGMVAGLITSLSGPVTLLADMLNGVLGFINSLPGPLASITIGLVAFLALAGKIGPMFAAPKSGGLLERIKYDFGQAEGAGTKFSTVAKGIGAGALAAVGGPWGIAIGILTTGFALAGQKADEARQQTEAYSAAIDEQTGKINENAAAMIAKKIVDDKQQAGVKTASEVFSTLGMSIQDVSNIVAEGGPAYEDLINKLKGGSAAATEMSQRVDESGLPIAGNADAWKEWSKSVGIGEDALNGLSLDGAIQLLESQKGSLDSNKNSWLQRNDAVSQGDQKLRDFNNAMSTYNDKTATADARTRALKQALDILNGKQPSLEEAQLKVNDAMRSAAGELSNVEGVMKLTGGAFRDAQGNLLNFNGVIDASTGVINTASTAGANLFRNLQDTTNGVLGTATAMKDAGKPTEDIAKYLGDARQQYIDMGKAAGLNGDVVAAAYDHMIGANPKDLVTTITAVGVDEAKSRIDNYKGTLDAVNAYKAVAHIAGDDAILGEKLANSYTSLGEFNKVIATATANLDPTQADAVRQRIIQDLINLAKTDPTVAARMDPALLDGERLRVIQRLNELGRMKPTPEVKAETEDAKNQLGIVQGLLAPFNNKTYSFSVIAKYTQSGKPVDLSGVDRQMANGAILDGYANGMRGFNPQMVKRMLTLPNVKAFANGGMEQHIAQIARPSATVRVWAEPETGGEAYIPLAATKRDRSTAILREVASQFGYKLTSVQQFADGGVVSGGNSRNSGMSIKIDTFNQHASDSVEDIGRGIMRQARNAGVTGILEGI